MRQHQNNSHGNVLRDKKVEKVGPRFLFFPEEKDSAILRVASADFPENN